MIKDIYSDRLCNISNDIFNKIPCEIPSHLMISDNEAVVYDKCIKAIRRCDYGTLYKGISFDGKACTLLVRKKWSNDIWKKINFVYNSKTTIKSIVELIENAKENEVSSVFDAKTK